MDPNKQAKQALSVAADTVEQWLATETQQMRVLSGLSNILARIPALAAAAAPLDESSRSTVGALYEFESARCSCFAKHVQEADRLAAYLHPLMSQMAQSLVLLEKAVTGFGAPQGMSADSWEAWMSARAVYNMLSTEHTARMARGASSAMLEPLMTALTQLTLGDTTTPSSTNGGAGGAAAATTTSSSGGGGGRGSGGGSRGEGGGDASYSNGGGGGGSSFEVVEAVVKRWPMSSPQSLIDLDTVIRSIGTCHPPRTQLLQDLDALR